MSFVKQKGSDKRTGVCHLSAHNDMTIYSAASNHATLIELYRDFKTFYIDLSNIEEIDSTGVQILISLTQTAQKQDKKVFLLSPSDAVKDVFNVLNVNSFFNWQHEELSS